MPKIQKITDPAKRATDPVLLKDLARRRINPDYVEFFQDYAPRSLGKGHSPYAKFYRDLKSGKELMVVSGLPMVNAAGEKVVVGWDEIEAGKKYKLKTNVFDAEIEDKTVTIEALNDQPSGEKQGSRVTFKPQLFLDGTEILCGQPTLLTVDPINPNYRNNVIEWDYGICKRRLRVIQGRIHGYWIFSQDPTGGVLIKYNQSQPRLKLSGYAINPDEEKITASEFAQAEYPLEIGDSATFYPDAHEETSTVDGVAWQIHTEPGVSWATLITDDGSNSNDAVTDYELVQFRSGDVQDKWRLLRRGIFLFDTSPLTVEATILAATLSFLYQSKDDQLGVAPDINVYSSAPASNLAVVPGDYNSLGDVAFSTAISYPDWGVGWNDFVLNAAGRAAISKTGISKFGTRNANYDVAEIEPEWSAAKFATFSCYFAERGTGYKPKLVVTYTPPPPVPVADGDLIGIGIIRKHVAPWS